MNTQTALIETLVNRKPEIVNQTRRGKVARLPKAARDLINHMLDDGLPYHVIIDELGEAGEGLNLQNLSNWKHGGYQDWLKHQEMLEKCRLQAEYATELLQEVGADASQIQAGCQILAAIQLFTAMKEHGDQALKELFHANPANYLRVIHTTCALSNATLQAEKHRAAQSLSSQIKVNQGSNEIAPTVPFASTPPVRTVSTPSPEFPTPAAAVDTQSSQFKVNQGSTEIAPTLPPAPILPVRTVSTPSPESTTPAPLADTQSSHFKVNQGSTEIAPVLPSAPTLPVRMVSTPSPESTTPAPLADTQSSHFKVNQASPVFSEGAPRPLATNPILTIGL